jgi:YVTN family beta-propeller protein
MGTWSGERRSCRGSAARLAAYGAVGVLIAAGSVLIAPTARAATGIPLLDPPKVTATVPVGDGPFGVAVNPISGRVYVANRDDDSVSVIDPLTNTVAATVPVGRGPIGAAVNPLTSQVYVADALGDTVAIIDPLTNTVNTYIPTGDSPHDVDISPLTGRA